MRSTINVLSQLIAEDEDPGDPQVKLSKPKRSRLRLAIYASLLALALVAIGWLGSWNSPIPVREVVVEGSDEASKAEILQVAALREGTRINEVDTDGIAERVVAISGIEQVDVEISRPWSIVIRVVQRHPFAVVAMDEGYSVIDEFGDEIRTARGAPKRLPVAQGDSEQMPLLLSILGELPEDFRRGIASAQIDKGGYAVLKLRQGGATVIWGSASQAEEKLAVLAALLPRKAKTYNVSVPERPAMTGSLDLPKENREPQALDRR
ncbi:MAG: cell division protein FtsQ/DivIB [Candidatus Nanopelagicales bacterium]|nr:cell division protein FtsQ/DivIB [Candidatus Nanopelagicales bacterium]MDZ4248515.1 cell division protein FtsQ/DivIB [Candidatus Nanopelagicales bacterium]MDZ7577891.1 cell division protein FtsQ/DivIB [Candidatus Nanopelagicales bacterium]